MGTAASALTTLANPSGSGGSSPGTVPGGSQNLNPLGSNVFTTLGATSPVVSTLPGGQSVPGSGVSSGQAPALNIQTPQALMGAGTTTSPGGGFNPGGGVTNPNQATTTAGGHTMLGDFQQTYGRGTGTAIANLVSGLGTSTSQALNTMDTAAINAAQQQYGNVLATQAAQGVSPNSSTAALMASDFSSQLTSALSSQAAQLGLSEEELQLSALMQEGTGHGGDTSFMGTLSSVLGSGILQQGAGAISQGFGLGGKGGSILDAIAGIA